MEKIIKYFCAGAFALMLYSCIARPESPTPTPQDQHTTYPSVSIIPKEKPKSFFDSLPKLPPEVVEKRRFQTQMELNVEHYLQQKLRDPDSLKDVAFSDATPTGKTNEFMIAVRYRAKNGFGGYAVAENVFLINTNKLTITLIELPK